MEIGFEVRVFFSWGGGYHDFAKGYLSTIIQHALFAENRGQNGTKHAINYPCEKKKPKCIIYLDSPFNVHDFFKIQLVTHISTRQILIN